MDVSVTDAKAQLTELVRRAEEGEEIVLTRHGQPAVRLTPVKRKPTPAEKRALMEEIFADGHTALPGPCAARSPDFVYEVDGLPAGSWSIHALSGRSCAGWGGEGGVWVSWTVNLGWPCRPEPWRKRFSSPAGAARASGWIS